ncbi:MAG: SGNH/GDSL hydrolase family protein [Planctomycetota bacterium]
MAESSEPQKETPRKRPSLRVRVLLMLVATFAALLAGEAAVRVRHYLKHGTFGPIYEFEIDEESGLRVPPVGENGSITINQRQFRGPEIEVPKPDGRLRIAFLGGSTTFCAEASADDKVWPHLVAQGLDGHFGGRSVDYVNGGAAGFDSGSSKKNLEIRMRDLEPDLVVIYHATNDFSKDAAEQAAEQGFDVSFSRSWLARRSMLFSLIEKNLLLSSRSGEDVEKIEVDLDAIVEKFEARLRALIMSSKERADAVAIATFAHRMRAGQSEAELQKNAKTALLYVPFLRLEDIVEGMDRCNELIRRLAVELEVVLTDEIDHIPADAEQYNDSVHFTDAGCQ